MKLVRRVPLQMRLVLVMLIAVSVSVFLSNCYQVVGAADFSATDAGVLQLSDRPSDQQPVHHPAADIAVATICPGTYGPTRTSVRVDGTMWFREVLLNGEWTGVPISRHSSADIVGLMQRVAGTGIYRVSPGSYHPPAGAGYTYCTILIRRNDSPGGFLTYIWGPRIALIPAPVLRVVGLFYEFIVS